jgi:hypothetical protein
VLQDLGQLPVLPYVELLLVLKQPMIDRYLLVLPNPKHQTRPAKKINLLLSTNTALTTEKKPN